jgi:hypothetical protein
VNEIFGRFCGSPHGFESGCCEVSMIDDESSDLDFWNDHDAGNEFALAGRCK